MVIQPRNIRISHGYFMAKMMNITPIAMVYGTYNYSYWVTGGPHIVDLVNHYRWLKIIEFIESNVRL